MIPEQYWQLARRWYWVIGLCAVLGAVAGYALLPSVVGGGASYNSTATLAVSQYIPVARAVDDSSLSADASVLASYTNAIAAYADTPQFRSDVAELLAESGSAPSSRSIDRMLTVTPNTNLFRLTISVDAGSASQAEELAAAASGALIGHAADEESRLSATLAATLEDQRDELYLRLDELSADKAAGIGDFDAENLEAGVIRSEIEDITAQIERLNVEGKVSVPLVTAGPPTTVHSDAGTFSPLDLLLLGAIAGLVAGWGAANLAERVTRDEPQPRRRVIAQPAAVEVAAPVAARRNGSALSELQIVRLAERAADLERRARRLDRELPNGAGTVAPHRLAN